jgi:hypothetical protein
LVCWGVGRVARFLLPWLQWHAAAQSGHLGNRVGGGWEMDARMMASVERNPSVNLPKEKIRGRPCYFATVIRSL